MEGMVRAYHRTRQDHEAPPAEQQKSRGLTEKTAPCPPTAQSALSRVLTVRSDDE